MIDFRLTLCAGLLLGGALAAQPKQMPKTIPPTKVEKPSNDPGPALGPNPTVSPAIPATPTLPDKPAVPKPPTTDPKGPELILPAPVPVPAPAKLAPPVPAGKPEPGPLARLLNAADVRTQLGLSTLKPASAKLAALKIAVLDFGFEGCDPKKLAFPPGSVLVEQYPDEWVKANDLGDPTYQKGFEPGNTHGRLMAQSAWAVTGGDAQGPVFMLLNANGPTMFRRAVRYAVQQGAQIILFSGHFEGGGNGDGRGPINAVVDEAIRAGVIWVNAAGNHHGRVFNGPITPGKDGYVTFGPTQKTALSFTNRLDENTFTITLTWNDYGAQEDAGTLKDLGLIVETAAGKEIGRADVKQIAGDRQADDGESRNPRERLVLPNLGAGTYRVRVIANAGTFEATDRLRVLLSPSRADPYPHPTTEKPTDPVVFTDQTNAEELYPPADNPRVLTVGESSAFSAAGPTADRRLKPDLILPLLPAKWSNGEVSAGTSYSAAYFAGVIATMKADRPDLRTNDVMAWLAELRKPHRAPVNNMRPRPAPVPWRTPTATELANLLAGRR